MRSLSNYWQSCHKPDFVLLTNYSPWHFIKEIFWLKAILPNTFLLINWLVVPLLAVFAEWHTNLELIQLTSGAINITNYLHANFMRQRVKLFPVTRDLNSILTILAFMQPSLPPSLFQHLKSCELEPATVSHGVPLRTRDFCIKTQVRTYLYGTEILSSSALGCSMHLTSYSNKKGPA